MQHAAVLLQVDRAGRETSYDEEGGDDGEEGPGAVGAVVHPHAHIMESAVPFLDAIDGQIRQLAYEGVLEDLARTEGDARVLDGVVDVADQTDAEGLDELDRLRGREIFVRQDAHVSRNEVQRRPEVEVARVVRRHRARLRLLVVVEEDGHGRLDERRGHEWTEPGHQVGVGHSQLRLGQLRRHAPRRPSHEGRRRRGGYGCLAAAPLLRSEGAVGVGILVVSGSFAVAAAVRYLLLPLAFPLDLLRFAQDLLLLAYPLVLLMVGGRERAFGLLAVGRRRGDAAQPPRQADEDAVTSCHGALMGRVDPAAHVDVDDGLGVFVLGPRVPPVVLLADAHLGG